MSDDWDVEQHKTEHECDEHWELKRKFLLAHKDKFPEDELVCLAQVFTNVELLGCRYPEETMKLIEELSHDVASEYREKQKNKLQRTFVKASDAASSKAKGLSKPGHNIAEKPEATDNTKTNTYNSTHNSEVFSTTSSGSSSKRTMLDEHQSKRLRTDESSSKKTISNEVSFTKSNANVSASKKSNEKPPKKAKADSRESESNPFKNVVLLQRFDDPPQNILACAARMAGADLEWKFDRNNNNTCKCTVLINSKQVAEAEGANQKIAKKEASEIAVNELRKYCYTIKIKCNLSSNSYVTTAKMLRDPVAQEPVPDDNIGRKLMKLMGWEGGGLGKTQQGITEPVSSSMKVSTKISRQGLGLVKTKQLEKAASKNLKAKCLEVLQKFKEGDMRQDLVFTREFTSDERAIIHQVARQLGLKSHSYGPKDSRQLVVSRKIDALDLVEELKKLGGTDKYELIEPTL